MIDRHDEKNLTGENYENCRVQQEVSNENYSGLRLVMRLISMINALLQNFIAG
jgi:hypothetical protein